MSVISVIMRDTVAVRLPLWTMKRGKELSKRSCEFSQSAYLTGSSKIKMEVLIEFSHSYNFTKESSRLLKNSTN